MMKGTQPPSSLNQGDHMYIGSISAGACCQDGGRSWESLGQECHMGAAAGMLAEGREHTGWWSVVGGGGIGESMA